MMYIIVLYSIVTQCRFFRSIACVGSLGSRGHSSIRHPP